MLLVCPILTKISKHKKRNDEKSQSHRFFYFYLSSIFAKPRVCRNHLRSALLSPTSSSGNLKQAALPFLKRRKVPEISWLHKERYGCCPTTIAASPGSISLRSSLSLLTPLPVPRNSRYVGSSNYNSSANISAVSFALRVGLE